MPTSNFLALVVAALPAAAGAAPLVCDVRDYGAKPDGLTVNTASIQAAIDACGDRGGTVYLGAGMWISGTLKLKSHMTLKLDHGAILAGSQNVADYVPGASVGLGDVYGTNLAGEGRSAGLLVARNVEDLTIEGPGTIDGQSGAFLSNDLHAPRDYSPAAVRNPQGFEAAMHDRNFGPFEISPAGRPGVLVLIFHTKDVSLRDLNLRDSPNWTLVLQDIDRAFVSDFSIINDPLVPNNDGIDCMSCRNVHIANGTIRTGDDDIVLVNGEDITVSGVSMYSRSAAVRLESTQRSLLDNLTIEANRGLAVFASRPITRPTDGVIFSNIVIRTHLMPGHWWGKAEPIYISVQPCQGPCAGGVRNVAFSNIEIDAEAGIMIAGAQGLPVSNVQLRDIRLRMVAPDARLSTAIGGNFDRRWTAATPETGIVTHDIPAISCEDTQALSLRNIDIDWGSGLPSYTTAAVDCRHFSGLDIDGLSETGPVPARGAGIVLVDGQGDRLRQLNLSRTRPQVERAQDNALANRTKIR